MNATKCVTLERWCVGWDAAERESNDPKFENLLFLLSPLWFPLIPSTLTSFERSIKWQLPLLLYYNCQSSYSYHNYVTFQRYKVVVCPQDIQSTNLRLFGACYTIKPRSLFSVFRNFDIV